MHLSNDIGPVACKTLTELAKKGELPSAVDNAVDTAWKRAELFANHREQITVVINAAASNNIDASLKRVFITQETIRDFAVRMVPLRLLSTVFTNVPLEGTDTIAVPYYPLQTAASQNFTNGDGTGGTGYQFGQATTTNKALITVGNRKYQPIDYSSYEFRRQPLFNAVKLGRMNMERLAADILTDVLSVVTLGNYGAAVKTAAAAALTSDDIIDIRAACNTPTLNAQGVQTAGAWPDVGRSLIVDATVDQTLQKDPAYKLALNIGTTSVIQEGVFPKLSGFEYAWMPNLPQNGQNLIGFAAFASGILSAFAPIDPAPGVRAQLAAYEVVTDPMTGISLNYRHWGLAQSDRDYEVIESAYGYIPGVAAAIKRICSQ
jgi:hypothetical protein